MRSNNVCIGLGGFEKNTSKKQTAIYLVWANMEKLIW